MPQIQSGQDVAEASGPNASVAFGEAGPLQASANSLKNVSPGAYAAAQPPGPGGPAGPVQGPPGGLPAMGAPQNGPPPSPSQPQMVGPETGRLDMSKVFPPMGKLFDGPPWRQWLRTAAHHPDAGPALARLADRIKDQHGPNY